MRGSIIVTISFLTKPASQLVVETRHGTKNAELHKFTQKPLSFRTPNSLNSDKASMPFPYRIPHQKIDAYLGGVAAGKSSVYVLSTDC